MYKLQQRITSIFDGTSDSESYVNVAELDYDEAKDMIEKLYNQLVEDSGRICNDEVFDQMACFIKDFGEIDRKTVGGIIDLISMGLEDELKPIISESDEMFFEKSECLERYALLAQSSVERLALPSKRESKQKRKVQIKKDIAVVLGQEVPNAEKTIQEILQQLSKLLSANTNKIWETSTEKDAFVSVVIMLATKVMETISLISSPKIKDLVLLIFIKTSAQHNLLFSLVNILWQSLKNFEHVSQILAELAATSVNHHNYTQLADELLQYVSSEDWGNISDKAAQKYISKFLISLSILIPKQVTRFMNKLITHLGSESYTVRTTIVEVIGYLINYSGGLEQTEQLRNQIIEYFDIIEQRFMDSHYIVRAKVLQVCQMICTGPAKFPKQRPRLVDLAIGRLEDKASNVRRNAMKALLMFLETHPYNLDGGELVLSHFENKCQVIANTIQSIISKATEEIQNNQSISQEIKSEEQENQPTLDKSEEIEQERDLVIRYKMELQYYQDAIRFVKQLETAIHLVVQLLFSTNRQEVIDAIKFLVQTERYKINGSKQAIHKMMHLVWQPSYQNISINTGQESNNLENKVMQTLYDAFLQLYINPIENMNDKENVNRVCNNLLELVDKASLADLASLEKILVVLVQNKSINNDVIAKLRNLYLKSSKDRRGAILILSMLSLASRSVVGDDIDLFLKIGLGKTGLSDFVVAKYTCDALKTLTKFNGNKRLSMSNNLFERLEGLLTVPTNDLEWFPAAQSALNAIYLLGDQPSIIVTEIIKKITRSTIEKAGTTDSGSLEFEFSQLLFVIGHVAIKEIELLEIVEADLKRRKFGNIGGEGAQEELAMVSGGGTEDDIGDLIASIRDNQLLYGAQSLLKLYSPIVESLCKKINDGEISTFSQTIKSHSIIALSKLMCISFEYCESNLPLLLALLRNSKDQVDRANIAIALGDISVCFNRLVGENLGFLYERLTMDSNINVKRTMLMVLTHLILNGMIKIKSHLGELAVCLEDDDSRISQLTKLFFYELATKADNVIYNNIPDIISTLSFNKRGTSIEQSKFDKIVKFLFQFIKDKQTDNIVEKLCMRFRSVQIPRQACDLAFCLSLLPYKNDKSLLKLMSMMPTYSQYLSDTNIYKYFSEISVKAKHNVNSSGVGGNSASVSTTSVVEFETKLQQARDRATGKSEDLMEVEDVEMDESENVENEDELMDEDEEEIYSDEE
ncbi:hypothetical protein BB558_003466 [Smittium angustum]|uniref:Condensin complex subunit 1 n=2 Tax=Smittium angustum TaxID=133377 RepID=A0A2U1J5X8_SMIAN|nr:hypothetical protein BB558_003466 [Smittium angustum]